MELATDVPTAPKHMQFYVDAYHELDTERDLTNFQPIPASAIRQYVMDFGLSGLQFEGLSYVIRELDNAMLEVYAQNKRREHGNPTTTGGAAS